MPLSHLQRTSGSGHTLTAVARGSWNVLETIAGPPQCGKSTLAVAKLRAYAGKCIRIAHDPAYSISGPDVLRHASARALRDALADPKRAGAIHCLDLPASDVLRAGYAYGGMLKKLQRASAVPLLVYFDEATSIGKMTPQYLEPFAAERLAQRRHEFTGYIVSTQRFQMLHPVFVDIGTRVTCFRLNHRQLRHLAELGAPDELVRRVGQLGRYQHVDWDLTAFPGQAGARDAQPRDARRLPEPGRS